MEVAAPKGAVSTSSQLKTATEWAESRKQTHLTSIKARLYDDSLGSICAQKLR